MGAGGFADAGIGLGRKLRLELAGQIGAAGEPGNVEQGQIEGVELGGIAPGQGVAAEQGGQRAAADQGLNLVDHGRKGDVVPVIPVDGLETGGTTGYVIRLGQDGYGEA